MRKTQLIEKNNQTKKFSSHKTKLIEARNILAVGCWFWKPGLNFRQRLHTWVDAVDNGLVSVSISMWWWLLLAGHLEKQIVMCVSLANLRYSLLLDI